MNFHTHSLSNVLTTSMLALKETWITASGVNSIWNSPETGGKLSLLCLSSFTCSCGSACLWKEVNWILNYTKNILNYGKNSLASLVQRRDQCLKLISSSTTYRNTCLLGQERTVGLYFDHSWFIHRTLVNFEVKFPIQGLQLWLVIKVRCHYCCYVHFLFTYNDRVTTLIWTPWIKRLRIW